MIRSSLFLLLLPALAYCQPITLGNRPADADVTEARAVIARLEQSHSGTLTVGSQYTTTEVDNARKTLAAIEPKKLAIKVGEFEVIEPGKTVTTPLLWLVQDESLLERITVEKDQPFALWMIRRGEPAARLHIFPSQKFTWAILVAKKEGAGSIQIVRNGDATDKPPVIVDRIDAVVGVPKPIDPPPPLVEDPLVKSLRSAAQKDAVAGKADKKWLEPLAELYGAASRDSLEKLATMGDLDDTLTTARTAAGIPDPDQQFPSLRRAIQQEMYSSLGVGATSKQLRLTNDLRVNAKACFARIAKALEVLAQ